MLKDREQWHRFAQRVRDLTARALAEHDLRSGNRPSQDEASAVPHAPDFDFSAEPETDAASPLHRIAAATIELLTLDRGEALADTGHVTLIFETKAQGVHIQLQLKGYAALEAHASKPGRLVSANGAIDVVFRFDNRGTAGFIIPDNPLMRAGLVGLTVQLEAP